MKRGWALVLGAGALALAVRCFYLWQIHDAPFFDLRVGDGEAYHLWARRIAAGDWLGHGVFYQAPLYPYFLALIYRLFDDSIMTVRLAQAFLSAASCALLAAAGVAMFGRRGALAGVALAVYPPAIFLDALIDKSCLMTFLLTALLVILAWRRWLSAGIVLGLLALTRENALILAVPIFFLAGRRGAMVFAAGCALVLLPVGVRNARRGGEFHLTTAQSGPNFYIGNHAGAPGWYEALVVGHGSAADEREDATRLAEDARGHVLPPGAVSAYWAGRALDFIKGHPLAWLGLIARKVALTFNNAEITDTESQDVYGEWSWLLRIPFGFGLVLAAAVANWRGNRFLWSLAGVYALSVAAFYVLARYRLPLVPILLLLAVSADWRLRQTRWTTIAAIASAAILAFVPLADARAGRATNYFAIATAFSKDAARMDDAISFYRRALEVDAHFPAAQFGLATVLTKTGRTEEAIPYYRAAIATWPDYEEARYNFGQALAGTGRVEDAVAQFAEAVRIRADDADAHAALGKALLRLGRVDDAVVQFARALELNPNDGATQTNLGSALANQGRIAEALPHFERAVALHPDDTVALRNRDAARKMATK